MNDSYPEGFALVIGGSGGVGDTLHTHFRVEHFQCRKRNLRFVHEHVKKGAI